MEITKAGIIRNYFIANQSHRATANEVCDILFPNCQDVHRKSIRSIVHYLSKSGFLDRHSTGENLVNYYSISQDTIDEIKNSKEKSIGAEAKRAHHEESKILIAGAW